MTQFDPADGGITTEVRGRILLIGLDRPAKMNGYTPQMANQLVAAFERLDTEDDLWCGVLFGHGAHFTAGLDLPKFHAGMKEGRRSTSGRIDPMSLGRRCRKPIVTAVQGVTFTLGIELMLAGTSWWPPMTAASPSSSRCAASTRQVAPLCGSWIGAAGATPCTTC
ncbi:MAG: hypothetical protein CM1200mP26_22180 [Acidimicrobiales bacterium]|nr:MAG: hypothetical protein CM1200mP26_22180 [Acidimicrobiales bacterium]